MTEEVWNDPRTWVAIVSAVIALGSLGFAAISHLWNRRESRHDVLGKVLLPMTQCAQSLKVAKDARQKRELLVFSYPAGDEPAVVGRVAQLDEKFNSSNSSAEKAFREAESQLAACSFRFPRSLAQSIQKGQQTLSELGRVVNEGIHHKAELELAKYRDDHGRIVKLARGWEIAGPMELLRRNGKNESEDENDGAFEFDLSKAEVDRILDLFHKRATTEANRPFVVHPPEKLLRNPEIAKSEDVVNLLSDSVFTVVFQDGTSAMLGLHELVAFTYQLIVVRAGVEEAQAGIREDYRGVCNVEISVSWNMRDLMRPEMVKLLLEKLDFSDRPSDANGNDRSN